MGRVIVTLASFVSLSFAQQGIAPAGYYPRYYQRMTFTGEVVEGPADVLTLRYKSSKTEQTFTGRFETPCDAITKDGKHAGMTPADVALGNIVTVYYYGDTLKTNAKPAKENVVIGIRFDVVNGKAVPLEHRTSYRCTHEWRTTFKAFNTGDGGAAVAEPGVYR